MATLIGAVTATKPIATITLSAFSVVLLNRNFRCIQGWFPHSPISRTIIADDLAMGRFCEKQGLGCLVSVASSAEFFYHRLDVHRGKARPCPQLAHNLPTTAVKSRELALRVFAARLHLKAATSTDGNSSNLTERTSTTSSKQIFCRRHFNG